MYKDRHRCVLRPSDDTKFLTKTKAMRSNKPDRQRVRVSVPETHRTRNPASLHPLQHENEQLLSQKHGPQGSKQATSLRFPLGKCNALLVLKLQRSTLAPITRAFSEGGGDGTGGRHGKQNMKIRLCVTSE